MITSAALALISLNLLCGGGSLKSPLLNIFVSGLLHGVNKRLKVSTIKFMPIIIATLDLLLIGELSE